MFGRTVEEPRDGAARLVVVTREGAGRWRVLDISPATLTRVASSSRAAGIGDVERLKHEHERQVFRASRAKNRGRVRPRRVRPLPKGIFFPPDFFDEAPRPRKHGACEQIALERSGECVMLGAPSSRASNGRRAAAHGR